MDPRSSLTKRLSKTAETFTDVADVIAESSSEEIYRVEPVEKAEHFSTTNPSSSRSGSAEYTRRRREQELQRRLSSDTENASETHLAPTRRRRRSRTPNRPKSPNGDSTPTKITKNRDKSPAPLAKIESDDTASDKKSPGLSFLPNFLAGTFRRFFNRPKIGPVTNSNDDSSEHVELSWAKKPPLKRVQVFRLPNVNAADGVGSSPPSVSSTSDENYNNLHLKPPDLESEHSSDPDVVVSKMISESTKSKWLSFAPRHHIYARIPWKTLKCAGTIPLADYWMWCSNVSKNLSALSFLFGWFLGTEVLAQIAWLTIWIAQFMSYIPFHFDKQCSPVRICICAPVIEEQT